MSSPPYRERNILRNAADLHGTPSRGPLRTAGTEPATTTPPTDVRRPATSERRLVTSGPRTPLPRSRPPPSFRPPIVVSDPHSRFRPPRSFQTPSVIPSPIGRSAAVSATPTTRVHPHGQMRVASLRTAYRASQRIRPQTRIDPHLRRDGGRWSPSGRRQISPRAGRGARRRSGRSQRPPTPRSPAGGCRIRRCW